MVACSKCKRPQEDCRSLHKFPLREPVICSIWVEYVARDRFVAKASSRLCGSEFNDEDLILKQINGRMVVKVKKGAVPKGMNSRLEAALQAEESDGNINSQGHEEAGGDEPGGEVEARDLHAGGDEQCVEVDARDPQAGGEEQGGADTGPSHPDVGCADEDDSVCGVQWNNKKKEEYWHSLHLDKDKPEVQVKKLFDLLCEAEQKLQLLTSGVKKICNEDQLLSLISEGANTRKWSPSTIGKCFQILFKVGNSSYEFLRSINWPLVSLRTIQDRLSALPFLPGVQHRLIQMLGKKINSHEHGRITVLSFDEMEVRPKLEVDYTAKTIVGIESEELGKNIQPGELRVANHLQLHILRGLAWHFKQVVAFDYTGPSVDPKKLWEYNIKIIKSAYASDGLFVAALSSDFGSNNKGMMRHVGVKATATKINVTVPHPADPSRLLVVTTDPPHSLKGVKKATLNYVIILPDWFIKKHSLPCPEVKVIEHLEALMKIQANSDMDLASSITGETLRPKGWEAMRVSDALAVFNHKVVSALKSCVDAGQLPRAALTTAHFISTVTRWYDVMKGRSLAHALFKCDRTGRTEETLDFLENEFIPLFQQLRMAKDNLTTVSWLPFMESALLCTKAVLTIYDIYVKNGPLEFLLASRLTTEAAENGFALVRAKGDAHPTLKESVPTVKKYAVSTSLQPPRGSSYADSGDETALSLLDIGHDRHTPVTAEAENLPPTDLCIEADPDEDDVENSRVEDFAVYHTAGWSLAKCLKVAPFFLCARCKTEMLLIPEEAAAFDLPYNYTYYLTQGGLRFVSSQAYHLADAALKYFKAVIVKQTSTRATNYSSIDIYDKMANEFLQMPAVIDIREKFPDCHRDQLSKAFCKNFFASLNRRFLKKLNESAEKSVSHASKSALMRTNACVQNQQITPYHEGGISCQPSASSSGIKRASRSTIDEDSETRRKRRRIMPSGKRSNVGIFSSLDCPILPFMPALTTALFNMCMLTEQLEMVNLNNLRCQPGSTAAINFNYEFVDFYQLYRSTIYENENISQLQSALLNAIDKDDEGRLDVANTFLWIAKNLTKPPMPSTTSDCFKGGIVARRMCLRCTNETVIHSDQYVLPLEVHENSLRLQALVNQSSNPQHVDDTCDICDTPGSMNEVKFYYKPPRCLVLQVQRRPDQLNPLKADPTLSLKLASNSIKKYTLQNTVVKCSPSSYAAICKVGNSNYLFQSTGGCVRFSLEKFEKQFSKSACLLFYIET